VSGEGVQASGAPDQGRYLPALDGLRALAITGVIAFHLGYGWASGGYLGVDLFFVLSGFLITTLLLEEWLQSGVVKLARFWGRRARRLLPALLLMVALVVVFVATESGGLPIDWSGLRGQALATVGYAANWQLLATHQSYFDQFTVASPLKHTWSLAIEEQFYLVWPLVIVAMMRLLRRFRRPASWRTVGLVLTAGGAVISAGWMAFLWLHGASVDRVYYGTDTRAFDLLAGAALAMMTVGRPQPSAVSLRRLRFASLGAVAVLAACWTTAGVVGTEYPRSWMFEGGFALCAVAGAVVIADVRTTKVGPFGSLLSLRPVRYVGKISYGLYLWHWPVIVELTPARTHTTGTALSAVRVAVTFGLAVTSYYLVEQPIRHGWPAIRLSWPRVAMAPAAMAATAVVILVGTVPPAVATSTAGQLVRTSASASASVPGADGVVGSPIVLGRTISKHRPLRILLVGDSVMLSEAPAIEALFASTGDAVVANESQWGYGLTNLHDWAPKLQQWVSQDRPDLIVAMWSWDNTAVATDPVAYNAEIDRFVQIALNPKDGAKGIVFQQFPAPGPDPGLTTTSPDYEARNGALIGRFDSLARSLTTRYPGKVVYAPIGSSVLLDGHFATWLPPEGRPDAPTSEWIRVRQIDNVHFCPAGAARYAAALMADLSPMVRLGPPSAGWLHGSWTDNFLAYRFPSAGDCPDDHP
jgi:peptidoglycan/LPS O-acetylase OafA/YrhL